MINFIQFTVHSLTKFYERVSDLVNNSFKAQHTMSKLYPETIVPLIKLCKQLDTLDNEQFYGFAIELILLVSKQNYDLLRKCVNSFICCNHMNFTPDLFAQLLQLVSTINDTKSINIIETIPEKELEESKQNTINITEIPRVLIINTLQYLNIKDIYQFEKCCRDFCCIARDTNSLHHLTIDYDYQFEESLYLLPKYNCERYLNIKSMHLKRPQDCCWNSNIEEFLAVLPTFKCIENLKYDNSNANLMCTIPLYTFQSKFVNLNVLIKIELTCLDISVIFKFLLNCSNIKQLVLNQIYENNNIYPQSIQESYLFKLINDNTDYNNENYPFRNLIKFSIDCSSISYSYSVQYFIYWILSNGKKHKTFKLTNGEFRYVDILDKFFNANDNILLQLKKKALSNISILHIEMFCNVLLKNIANSIKLNAIQFDEFILRFVLFWLNLDKYDLTFNLTKNLKVLVSHSKYCTFNWTDFGFHAASLEENNVECVLFHWPVSLNILLNSTNVSIKIFDKIKIARNFRVQNEHERDQIYRIGIKSWLKLKQIFKNITYCVTYYDRSFKKSLFSSSFVTKLQTLCAMNDVAITTIENDLYVVF